MDDPLYTQKRLNEALRSKSDIDLCILWDGNDPSDVIHYTVLLNDEETVLRIWEHELGFDVLEEYKPNYFCGGSSARTYEDVASDIIKNVAQMYAEKIND